MTGPKHLWSGNWQEESRQPDAAPPEPVRSAVPARPDPIPVRRPGRPMWRALLPTVAVVLLVAVALAELLPSGRSGDVHHGATTPSASVIPNSTIPNSPAPSPVVPNPTTPPGTTIIGRTVTWLGMQISTVENVGVVIQTVQLGSPADAAGLDPGDIIESVNHHSISAANQLRSAVRGLKAGDAVQISVDRGSTLFATVADFAGPPITSP
jgi:membrane-associated protease RseP (regulator of RpoE activity)